MANSSTGYIDSKGKYIRGENKPLINDVNSMHKDWEHTIGRKEFSREIIQPHINGKPNRAFIEAYPEYSLKYWNQETIDKIMREQI